MPFLTFLHFVTPCFSLLILGIIVRYSAASHFEKVSLDQIMFFVLTRNDSSQFI
jgi:hypothetical protein